MTGERPTPSGIDPAPESVSASGSRAIPGRISLIVAAFVLLHIVLAWFARAPGFLTGQDDLEYVALAQSLRDFGYNELHVSGAPLHRQYPPGYPALLAVWGGLFGDRFDALVMLNVLFSAGALVLLFEIVRRRFDDRLALLTVVVLAVNPALVHFAGIVASESAYIFVSLLTLYLVQRAGDRTRGLMLAGGTALFAALTRSAGITLLAALALHWLMERRWRLVLIPCAGGGVALIAWLVFGAVGPEQYVGSSYAAELRSMWSGMALTGPLITRAGRYVFWYVTNAVPHTLAVPSIAGTRIDNGIAMLVLAATGLAGLLSFYRRWRPAAIYLCVYALLLTVWLWALSRFVVVVVPLLVPLLLAGAFQLSNGRRYRVGYSAAAVLALVLAMGGAVRTAAEVQAHASCPRQGEWPPDSCMSADQSSYFSALRFVRDSLPEDAVVLAAKSGALWFYTGRVAVPYEEGIARDADSFLPFLRRHGAEWVLLGSLRIGDAHSLGPLIRENCDQLVTVAVFPPRTWLFRAAAGVTAAQEAVTCAAADAHAAANGGRAW